MDNCKEFNHLILLIGTNPLPNFVVADYFLQINHNIQTIWLIHSEANKLQVGTDKQAKNLEALLRKRWEGKHQSLRFPLEKVSLSDVSDAVTIRGEIEKRLLKKLSNSEIFHLNYTGGTKAMASHVYLCLEALQKSGQRPFSYLDGNNFRLIVDEYGIIADDLRQKVQIDFAELIGLHGFQRVNQDRPIDFSNAQNMFQKFIDPSRTEPVTEGYWLEEYIAVTFQKKLANRLNSGEGVLHNWVIKNPDWWTKFELDVIFVHGYHLTGISCTVGFKKESCKSKGFEIIQRTKQIGGDEARAILITGSNKNQTKILQDELVFETGGSQNNVLALGIEDLRNEKLYIQKIEEFVFG